LCRYGIIAIISLYINLAKKFGTNFKQILNDTKSGPVMTGLIKWRGLEFANQLSSKPFWSSKFPSTKFSAVFMDAIS